MTEGGLFIKVTACVSKKAPVLRTILVCCFHFQQFLFFLKLPWDDPPIPSQFPSFSFHVLCSYGSLYLKIWTTGLEFLCWLPLTFLHELSCGNLGLFLTADALKQFYPTHTLSFCFELLTHYTLYQDRSITSHLAFPSLITILTSFRVWLSFLQYLFGFDREFLKGVLSHFLLINRQRNCSCRDLCGICCVQKPYRRTLLSSLVYLWW